MCLAQSSVVQRGDDRLAGSGRCDNEIAVPVVKLALCVELLQHLGLVGLGLHFQTGQGNNDALTRLLTGGDFESFAKFVTIRRRAVGLELAALPVRVKRGPELVH